MSTCDSQQGGKAAREQLLELYTRLATTPESDFGWGKGKENARALGYDEEWLNILPDEVWESAAAVGNPFSLGPIGPGETIVDLGCGAGADACVAGLLVGAAGSIIGIDCTPAMIDKSTTNARLSGLEHAIFQQAEISQLPLPDACIDVAISNGAINLAEDKGAVLAEVFRVLKPNGRLHIADMVRDPSVEVPSCCASDESWADCVSGTLEPNEFIALMRDAGFSNVSLIAYTGYRTAQHTQGALFYGVKRETDPTL